MNYFSFDCYSIIAKNKNHRNGTKQIQFFKSWRARNFEIQTLTLCTVAAQERTIKISCECTHIKTKLNKIDQLNLW